MSERVSDERLTEMLAGLEGVTPGPWYTTGSPWFSGNDGVLAGSPDGNIAYLIADCDDSMNPRTEYVEGHGPFPLGDKDADAAHIARCDPDTIRSIITELQSLRRSSGRAVKGLEWRQSNVADRWAAETCWGEEYEIIYDGRAGRAYGWFSRGTWIWLSSLDEAKAAAQADYERRILSALAPHEPASGETQPSLPITDEAQAREINGLTVSTAIKDALRELDNVTAISDQDANCLGCAENLLRQALGALSALSPAPVAFTTQRMLDAMKEPDTIVGSIWPKPGKLATIPLFTSLPDADGLIDDTDRDMIARGDRIGADMVRALLLQYDRSHTIIQSQAETIARLERERDEARESTKATRGLLEYTEDSIARLERKWKFQLDRADATEARLARAMEALRPFASEFDRLKGNFKGFEKLFVEEMVYVGGKITLSHLRAAREFLEGGE